MTTKQILIINDLCSYGKVSTTAMLPILSYLGVPTGILPTSLVSNTFDYGDYSIMETTDFLKDSFTKWKKLGFGFEAIATGFIPSRAQADLISAYCKEQAAAAPPYSSILSWATRDSSIKVWRPRNLWER